MSVTEKNQPNITRETNFIHLESNDAFAEQRSITLEESRVEGDTPRDEDGEDADSCGEILEELQEVFEVRDTPAIGAAFLA